jgi:uncharacterized repeat protein (TIGR02543 family)
MVADAEYSFNGGAYSATNTFTSTVGETVTLAIRLAATATHNASPASTETINTANQNQNPPAAFTLTVTANGETDYTVAIPTTADAEYSFDGINWSGTNTITGCLPGDNITGYKRIAAKTGFNASGTVSANVTLPPFQVQTPTASPNGGTFATSQNVTLATATSGADIYYTTDGSTPTTGSTQYTGTSIAVSSTTTIKAIAVKAGMTNSAVLSVTITINSAYTITFDANGGSVTPSSAVTGADGKLSSLPTPTRSGYSFDGWFTAASGGTQITTATVFTANTAIYAHWTYTGGNGSGTGSATKRQIYLSSAPEGFTYDRPAGMYFMDSRGDFVFVIISTVADANANSALKAAVHPLDNLIVTTGTTRDTDGRVILERIATDSMRVTIKMVNQNITITVRNGTPDGTETVEGAKVWSYGGELHLYSPTAGEAWIYSLTGQLVKKLAFAAGETVTQPLARGIYIVRIDGKTWKVIN